LAAGIIMVSTHFRTARADGEVSLSAGFARLENRIAGASKRADGTRFAFQGERLAVPEMFPFGVEGGLGRAPSHSATAAA
jgi:hypothetical protein